MRLPDSIAHSSWTPWVLSIPSRWAWILSTVVVSKSAVMLQIHVRVIGMVQDSSGPCLGVGKEGWVGNSMSGPRAVSRPG